MCTLTTHRNRNGLLLTMNRDEHIGRGAQYPPVLQTPEAGPAWVGPMDEPSGGTWIGASEAGVVVGLLNFYPYRQPAGRGPFASRGAVVPLLLALGSAKEIRTYLRERFDPRDYPSFSLVVADARAVTRHHWTGTAGLSHENNPREWTLCSSSSWRTGAVLRWRAAAFEQWRSAGCPFAGPWPEFHISQPAGRSWLAPLVRRDTAATLSITQVQIDTDADRLLMRYWPNPTETPADREQICESSLSLH